MSDPDRFAHVREGALLVVDEGGCLYQDDAPLDALAPWDTARVADATACARANLGSELEKFARNTLQYLDADKDLLLDPTDVPAVPGVALAGRHALIVVRGEGYREDLIELRPYLRDVRPVLIAVDGGADALLAMGYRPDVILGDMDSVSDEALRCGARLIVHAYRHGAAPGLARVRELGLEADVFPVPGTSEDAALLLAYEHGADLIVAVGTHSNLEDFLDKGRAGMASTFLTRLRVSDKFIDAKGVSRLYRQRISTLQVMLLAIAGLVALGAALAATPGGQTFYGLLGARFDDLLSWVTGFFVDPRPEALLHYSRWPST
jgi:uncharacterized membrane-anchored protein